MAGPIFRGLLTAAGGGGGGGGGGGSGLTPYDDNFDESGSTIDTVGNRFTGANPWILYNIQSPFPATFTMSGGLLTMDSGGFGTNGDIRVAYQNSLPATTFRVRAKITPLNDPTPFPHAGIILREAATTKWICNGLSGTTMEVRRGSGTNGWATNYTGGSVSSSTGTFWVEVERSGTNLIFRLTDNATDGNDLTTALGTTITTVAQTADFTTAPDQIGLDIMGASHTATVDWFLRLL
jgi:hypothetical protein